MDRSTIYYLKQKGWTNTQIAEFMGHHRDTIARVLREPVEQPPPPRQRASTVSTFDGQIQDWLRESVPVTRMLELARQDAEHPYQGGASAFFAYVRKYRRAQGQVPTGVVLRFEGLPGEFLQIDWGEERTFPFAAPALAGVTRYFFAARLKYSRWMFLRFTPDMREETLLRCLIACFTCLGGVPWVVTTDNMKTVVVGRDRQHQPIWHPAYQKLAAEFGFHPEVCMPAAGNQKGAVENLVKFVQTNFLAGRSFHDEADLAQTCALWLEQVNTQRLSQATEQTPASLLPTEQTKFGPVPKTAADYGFFDSLVVSREALVSIETNRYSVPAQYIGQVVTARIHLTRIEVFVGSERVASHARHPGRNQRILDPTHFEAVFVRKPRGRVMVYRDWLVTLAPQVAEYVSVICHKRRSEMAEQILALYDLAQQLDRGDFLSALDLAAEQHLYGVEYLRAILTPPVLLMPHTAAEWPAEVRTVLAPTQREVERDLAQYECYVANRSDLAQAGTSRDGGHR